MARLKNARDKNVRRFEHCMMVLNMFLLVLTIAFIGSGVAFITHDLWGENEYMLKEIKAVSISLMVSYSFILSFMAILGIYVSNSRRTANGTICCYALVLLFVVAIPLLVEGGAIMELDRLSEEELNSLGNMSMSTVVERYNPITVGLVREGKRFDLMAEMVLDGYMCSRRTCPCTSYRTPEGRMTEELFKNETLLLQHDRTFAMSRQTSDSFMYFTTNYSQGFKNVHDCFTTWNELVFQHDTNKKGGKGGRKSDQEEERAREDAIEGAEERHKKVKADLPPYGAGVGREMDSWERKTFGLVIAEYLQNYELYVQIEDAFQCSGMFTPALFYFGKDLHEGPPKETCAKHFKRMISQPARIFATSSVLAGILSLILVMTHCGYYSRPRKTKKDDSGRERSDS